MDIRYIKTTDTKKASLYFKEKYIKSWTFNEYKKPIKDGVFFNISHSHGLVVFVEADSPIGIDVEKVRNVDDKLKRFVSSDEEFDGIKTNEDFFKVWTSKESLVKAEGTGVRVRPPKIPALPFNGAKIYNEKNYFSKQIKFEDYIISVTILTDKDFDIKMIEELI